MDITFKGKTIPFARLSGHLKARVAKAIDSAAKAAAKARAAEEETNAKRAKLAAAPSAQHDTLERAHGVAPSGGLLAPKPKAATDSIAHVAKGLRAPSPGLALASVKVAPTSESGTKNATGPKVSGFAWRTPKK